MDFIPIFINNATSIPANAVGTTLANIWNLALGNHVSLLEEKQNFRQKKNLEDFIENLENKTQEVPEEFLMKPPLHIIGPAIDASKYYLESEELRQLFANLIGSSIDTRKSEQTHPSFVEIIKQLSPIDARILENFMMLDQIPIAQLRATKENEEYSVLLEHIINLKDNKGYKSHATSTSNLERLGLLKITYSAKSPDKNSYNFINKHPSYAEAKGGLIRLQDIDEKYNKIEVQEGLCYVTPLGSDFIDVCM